MSESDDNFTTLQQVFFYTKLNDSSDRDLHNWTSPRGYSTQVDWQYCTDKFTIRENKSTKANGTDKFAAIKLEVHASGKTFKLTDQLSTMTHRSTVVGLWSMPTSHEWFVPW